MSQHNDFEFRSGDLRGCLQYSGGTTFALAANGILVI